MGCMRISKLSYRSLRCVFFSCSVPQRTLTDYCSSADLPGSFRSLFVRAQSSHHPFGSGHVPAHRAGRERRFVRSQILSLSMLTYAPGLSQKEWLADAANLVSRLDVVLQALDNAVNQLNDTGKLLPVETHEKRRTYLLMSSCKLFCMTARARIYMEISKLPIVPKGQINEFQDLAKEPIQAFFRIYKSFGREGDIRHLDYFVIVSQSSGFLTMKFSMSLTFITVLLGSYS